MPPFDADTAPLSQPAAPGSKVPEAEYNFLRGLGATEFYPRKWEYRSPLHTLRDIVRPGYFSGDTRANLRVGDEIHYTACGGHKLPSEWERGILVVEEQPNTAELPLIVAIVTRHRKATPVRHDGAMDEDERPKGKRAA